MMGIGTTGIASLKLNRKFIGIEKDQNFFLIAQTKLEKFINNKIDLAESNSKL